MRKPSDRKALFQRWRERTNRIRPREWPFDFPQCGRYSVKRNGQLAAVQIDIEQEIDELTGELISEERFYAVIIQAEQLTRIDDDLKVLTVWQRAGANPITDEEFTRISRMPLKVDLSKDVIV